jgi:hypothetical protein
MRYLVKMMCKSVTAVVDEDEDDKPARDKGEGRAIVLDFALHRRSSSCGRRRPE